MTAPPDAPVPPRWLHGWAILTVCVTLPLLFLGAEVTTKNVGMADPRGFRPPWELVATLLREWTRFDLRIEYSHRIAGMVVGSCGILLLIGLWLAEPRRSVRWLGALALALICAQGALGYYRVELDTLFGPSLGKSLALVHGLFAQVVIATLVCLAVVLSRGWALDRHDAPAPAVRRWALLTSLVIFVQLLFGGMTRHKDFPLGPRGHLLGAFAVVASVVCLVKLIRESEQRESFRRAVTVLVSLLCVQLLLGVEAWLSRFYIPAADLPQLRPLSIDPDWLHWLRSAHYVVGTLLFATSTVVALKAYRRVVLAPLPAPTRALEAVL
jgi:cytochrome c oxidase assembly protein subunit 15